MNIVVLVLIGLLCLGSVVGHVEEATQQGVKPAL